MFLCSIAVAFIIAGRNGIITVKPCTQINKFAAFRAKWAKGIFLTIKGATLAYGAI